MKIPLSPNTHTTLVKEPPYIGITTIVNYATGSKLCL